jgi:hypothetical protein
MATISDVLTFARAQALTDSNGLTDTNGIIFANEALLDLHNELITHGIDASQIQESYTSGTVNQGTYLYPTNMWFLKAIEVNFTDTTPSNYITASQLDASNIPAGQSFSWLRANQNRKFPIFDDRGDYFEIFPTPVGGNNLTDMFRILYFLEPTEYTSTSDTISYPVSLDYRILGWRVASSYLKSLSNWESAEPFDIEYKNKLTKLVKTLGRGTQQPMQAVPIQDTGWNF